MFNYILEKKRKNSETSDFTDFVVGAPSRKKKKIWKRVIHNATKDQQRILDKYKKELTSV